MNFIMYKLRKVIAYRLSPLFRFSSGLLGSISKVKSLSLYLASFILFQKRKKGRERERERESRETHYIKQKFSLCSLSSR